MKKILAMILAAAMLLCFCACGDNNAPGSKEGKGGKDKTKEKTDLTVVTDEPAKTGKVYTYFEDTEYEGKISHSLTVCEDKTFVLKMSFSHKMGEDDCELIKVDYSEGVTNSTLYDIRGSYTVDGEGKLIPTITKVLYKEMYITDAGKDVSANVLDYLEECHENGEVKDSIYEMYLKVLKGEWTDIASEFTPEIHYFEINDSDMTFDYSASGL